MDWLRNNPDVPLMVTFGLWPVAALVLRGPRAVFWASAVIVFVGIRVDTWQHGEIEMGGLLHAAAGGLFGYLLWALKARLLRSNPKGLRS